MVGHGKQDRIGKFSDWPILVIHLVSNRISRKSVP